MLKYQHHSGDVYEITDTELIQKFVKSINGMTFTQKDDLSHSSGSYGRISFFNSDGECLDEIAFLNDRTILHGSWSFESGKAFELNLLDGVGEFIENIYTKEK